MKTLIKITIAAAALAAVSTSVAAKPFGHGTAVVQTVPAWLPKPPPFPEPVPGRPPFPRPDPVCLSCPPIDFGNALISDGLLAGGAVGQFGPGY